MNRSFPAWRISLLPLLILPLIGCGERVEDAESIPSDDPAEASGTLVIVGGSLDSENSMVYQAILRGRSGSGPFCIIPTASADPQRSMEGSMETFSTYLDGELPRGILATVDNPEIASDPGTVETIRTCSGFFFTGGSQSRIAEVFRSGGEDTPALAALRERLAAGAVISGSSAGAAMMTDPMIGGGGSAEALEYGVRAGDDGEGVLLLTGLGFLDGVQVDQHFLARGRWGRLVTALLAVEEDSLAFGIDEETSLEVKETRSRVVGESGVIFLDDRDAGREEGGHGGYGITLYLLGHGDQVDLASGEVTPRGDKVEMAATGEPFAGGAFPDLFGRGILDDLLTAFALSSDPRVTFAQEGQMVELRKGTGFRTLHFQPALDGSQGPVEGRFLGPFVLSVFRERPDAERGGE